MNTPIQLFKYLTIISDTKPDGVDGRIIQALLFLYSLCSLVWWALMIYSSRKTDPTSESLLLGKKLGPDEVGALGLWAQEIGPSLLIFGRLFMRLSLQYNKAKVGCFLAFIGFSSSLNYEKP